MKEMNFMSGKEYTARTIEEALERALNEMMLTRDDVEIEVLTHPSRGILGIGRRDAVIRVKKKVIEELKEIVADIKEERQAEVKPETLQEESKNDEEIIAVVQQESGASVQSFEDNTKEEFTDEEKTLIESVHEHSEKSVQMDKKAALVEAEAKGKEFLVKIFKEMDLDVTIDVKEKNGYLNFDLKGKNLGILIGRRGDTLDSLQFLMNLVINDKNGVKVKGIIDIENYRAKREETLIGLSHKLAAKARKTGQKVVLEPMNPQERRIIHMALQNDRRVSTYSEGEEPYRKVVIVPEIIERDHNRRREQRRA